MSSFHVWFVYVLRYVHKMEKNCQFDFILGPLCGVGIFALLRRSDIINSFCFKTFDNVQNTNSAQHKTKIKFLF